MPPLPTILRPKARLSKRSIDSVAYYLRVKSQAKQTEHCHHCLLFKDKMPGWASRALPALPSRHQGAAGAVQLHHGPAGQKWETVLQGEKTLMERNSATKKNYDLTLIKRDSVAKNINYDSVAWGLSELDWNFPIFRKENYIFSC